MLAIPKSTLQLHIDTTAPHSSSPSLPSSAPVFVRREYGMFKPSAHSGRSGDEKHHNPLWHAPTGQFKNLCVSVSYMLKLGTHIRGRACQRTRPCCDEGVKPSWNQQSGLRQCIRQHDITRKKPQCLELHRILMGFIFVCKLSVPCQAAITPQLPLAESCSVLTTATNTHILIITILNVLYRVNHRSLAAIFTFLQWKSRREKKRSGGRDGEGTISCFWALNVITFLMLNLWYLILCTMNTLCGSPDLIWH